MGNTFDAVPPPAQGHERSTAFLPAPDPQGLLERVVDEAGKHRGTLREQDGCTVPFREGGSLRIRVEEDGDRGAGLELAVDAPTVERREHVERTVGELLAGLAGGDADRLEWRPAG